MANPEHLALIKKSISDWNAFLREQDKGFRADLTDADLRGAILRGAILRGANLIRANLRGANLRGANLTDADLRGAILRGANLTDAILRSAILRGANLTGANLRGANLTDAILIRANLRGANLRGANLRGANLTDAILRSANLKGAILRGANVRSVLKSQVGQSSATWDFTDLQFVRNLRQEQLESMKGDSGTLIPDSLTRPAHWSELETPAAPESSQGQDAPQPTEIPADEPPYIMVSYAVEEAPLIGLLVQEIERLGLRVWWSQNIKNGAAWRQEIAQRLDKAQNVFVIWTDHSTPRQFVHGEAQRALDQNKYHGIKIGTPQPPLPFGELQFTAFEGWGHIRAIAEAIMAIHIATEGNDVDPYSDLISQRAPRNAQVSLTEEGRLQFTRQQAPTPNTQGFDIAMKGLDRVLKLLQKQCGNANPPSLDLLRNLATDHTQNPEMLWDGAMQFMAAYSAENPQAASDTDPILKAATVVIAGLLTDFPNLKERAKTLDDFDIAPLGQGGAHELAETAKTLEDNDADGNLSAQVRPAGEYLRHMANEPPSAYQKKRIQISAFNIFTYTALSEKATRGHQRAKPLHEKLVKSLRRWAGALIGIPTGSQDD